jgi:hypothetical protein
LTKMSGEFLKTRTLLTVAVFSARWYSWGEHIP